MKKVILLLAITSLFSFHLSAQQKISITAPTSVVNKIVTPKKLSTQRNNERTLFFEEDLSLGKNESVFIRVPQDLINANNTYEVVLTVFTGDADLGVHGQGDDRRLIRFSEKEGLATEKSFFAKSDLLNQEHSISIEVFGFEASTCRIEIFEESAFTTCTFDFWFEYLGNKTTTSNCRMTYAEGHDLSIKVGTENQHEIKDVSLFFRDQAFFDDSAPFEWSNIERNMSPGTYPISMTMTDICGNTIEKKCTIVIERRNTCATDFWFDYKGTRASTSNCRMVYAEGHDLSVVVGVTNPTDIKEITMIFRDQAFFDDSFPFEWATIEKNMSEGSYPISITMTDNCGHTFEKKCTIVIEQKTCNADFWFLYNGNKTSSSNCRMTYAEGHDLSVKVGTENQHEIKDVSLFFRDQAFFDDSAPFEWSNIEKNMSEGSYPISMTMTDICGNTFEKKCTIVIERKTCVVDCWFDYKGDRTSNDHCEMIYEEGHDLSVKVGTNNPNDIKEVLMIFRDQAFIDDSFPFEWNEIEKNMSPGTYPISMTITDICDKIIQKTCTIIITEKRPDCISFFPEGHNLTIRAGVTHEDDIKEIALIFRDQVFFDDTFPFEWIDVERNMSIGTYPIKLLLTDDCGNIIQKECTIVIEPKVCETDFWFEYKGDKTSSTHCEMVYDEGHDLSIKVGVENEADIKDISLFFRDQAFFDDNFPFEFEEIEKNMSVGNHPIRMLLTDDCGNTFQRECTIIIRTKVCATDLWFDFSENNSDGGNLTPHENDSSTAKESAVIDNVPDTIEKASHSIKSVGAAIKEELPTNELTLIQNIPNPFEGNTSFRFYNPTDNEVALSVFDMSGKQLVQQKAFYTKGWHEVSIDSQQLRGTGIYIYEMNNGKAVVRKKMMAME